MSVNTGETGTINDMEEDAAAWKLENTRKAPAILAAVAPPTSFGLAPIEFTLVAGGSYLLV